MKTKSLLAAAALLFSSAASADVVEANVTFAIKVHEQAAGPVVIGSNNVMTYGTYTLKNADIIKMIGDKEARVFSKRAKIIYQMTYDAEGIDGISYRIRDQGQEDLLITGYIQLGSENVVVKSKYSTAKNTGSGSALALGEFDLRLNGTFEGLYLVGPVKMSLRQVTAIEFPETIVQLGTVSMTLAGQSLIGAVPKSGYATGTVKVSGFKFIN